MSDLQVYLDEALETCDFEKDKRYNNVNNMIGNEIIKLRMENGITQKQMASLCGIQQSNVSRLEKGVYNPSVQLLEKIAKAMGKELVIKFI